MNSLSFSKIFVFLASELHWKYRWSTWAFDVWFHMEVFHHSFHEKVSLFLTVYSFYLSPWTYMLYLTCHNFTRELHKQSCHWCVCICLWEGPSVNLQFIMILFANIYCKMLKNTQEKMFWYVFCFLTNDIKIYGRAMLHIRGSSGIRLLITTVKLLNWMGKMQLTIPTGQQLTYNWDGMIVCLIYVSLLFCYTESFLYLLISMHAAFRKLKKTAIGQYHWIKRWQDKFLQWSLYLTEFL